MPIKLSTRNHEVLLIAREPTSLTDTPIIKWLGRYAYDYELVRKFASKDQKFYIYKVMRIPESRKAPMELDIPDLSYDPLVPDLGIKEIEFD